MERSRTNNNRYRGTSPGRRVVPDPAFNARRALPWAFSGVAVLALILLWQMVESGHFAALNPPVNKISVLNPLQFVSEREVGNMAAAELGKGFFSLDVAAVKQRLEQHPWVASAGVTRVWPDHLAIRVTEEVPIARWGERQLLNQYGEVFSPPDSRAVPMLPVLVGPPDQQRAMMLQFKAMTEILFPAGLRLQQLTLSERGSWELELSDGVVVVVGRKDIRERLRRFLDIYDSRIRNDIALIEKVDLRYSNGLAVKHATQAIDGVAVR